MKKKIVIPWVIAILLIATHGVMASPAPGAKSPKPGILLVAFGSSEASSLVAFENIEKKTILAFPDIPVFWAYTSRIVRAKIAKQGVLIDSPEIALARMMDQGFTHVVVQSLHTILGTMHEDLTRTVDAFRSMGKFDKILLGDPLLATQEDMVRTVDAILATLPGKRKKEEAVVLMGHGTHHPANAFYAALMFQIQLRDPLVFVGTVEGYPEIHEIQSWLAEKQVKTAWLIPFMAVAGDHAKNDMAGGDEDSWQSILTQAGITCNPVLKGTGEFDAFADIWVAHIQKALGQF